MIQIKNNIFTFLFILNLILHILIISDISILPTVSCLNSADQSTEEFLLRYGFNPTLISDGQLFVIQLLNLSNIINQIADLKIQHEDCNRI